MKFLILIVSVSPETLADVIKPVTVNSSFTEPVPIV